jgi:hypothetical protein
MVERKASRRSVFVVSCSGEEKRSVKVGVHAEPGSKEEATLSVVEALDNLPVRMNVKSKVGCEVIPEDMGGQDVGTVLAGEILDTLGVKKLLVSILGGICGFRVGIALKLCSRIRNRFS